MKRTQWLINIVLLAGLLGLGGYQLLKKEKIVYVDIGILMQEYQGMKDARNEYDKKAKEWQGNVDTLISDWKKELQDYEKERKGFSSKERVLKEELLHNKQQQIAQYQESIKMNLQEEESKATQIVLNQVNEFLTRYGKEKGYTFILGANGSGNIVYADDARNITSVVLEKLQEEHEK